MAEATAEGGRQDRSGRSLWDRLTRSKGEEQCDTAARVGSPLETALSGFSERTIERVNHSVDELQKEMISLYGGNSEEVRPHMVRIESVLAKAIPAANLYSLERGQSSVEGGFMSLLGLVRLAADIASIDKGNPRRGQWTLSRSQVLFLKEERRESPTQRHSVQSVGNAGGFLDIHSRTRSWEERVDGGWVDEKVGFILLEMVGEERKGHMNPTKAQDWSSRVVSLDKSVVPTEIKGIFLVKEGGQTALVAGKESDLRSGSFHLVRERTESLGQDYIRGTL